MAERSRSFGDDTTGIELVGLPKTGFSDLYHSLLQAPFWVTFAAIAVVFFGTNLLFGVAYWLSGGVSNVRLSFGQAFFFSVQTFGTIGYGTMYPTGGVANVLMTFESLTSITIVALFTGLLFAKFSQPHARIRFSKDACVHPFDGIETLTIRLANERSNFVVEAQVRLVLIKREKLKEGNFFFKMYDLALLRDRSPALTRSWVVMHPITEKSPLFGMKVQDLTDSEAQIIAHVTGIDSTSSQTIHGQLVYDDIDVKFGCRHVDMMIPLGGGRYRADYTRFDQIEPFVMPTPDA